MSIAEATPGERSLTSGKRLPTSGAIDCDNHPHFRNGIHDLGPYLSEAMSERINVGNDVRGKGLPASEFKLPHPHYVNPGGGMRQDAVPPSGGAPNSDPEYAITDHLDRFDLGASVLLGGQVMGISGYADADVAAAIAGAYNDWMAENWLSADPRFKGSIVVAPQDPAQAVAEIERCAGDDRMVQVFMPVMAGAAFGKRQFWPIYEAAQHYGLPVATHPGGESAGMNAIMGAIDAPSYYFDFHTGLDQIYQRTLISLVAEGVFEQFPRLKFGLIEGGFAWLPAVLWKMDKNWKGLRREVPWLKRLPSEYVREHVRFTTQPMPEPPVAKWLDWLFEMAYGDEVMMFSTDYPHWDGDDADWALKHIPKHLHQTIMVDTPMAYYRM